MGIFHANTHRKCDKIHGSNFERVPELNISDTKATELRLDENKHISNKTNETERKFHENNEKFLFNAETDISKEELRRMKTVDNHLKSEKCFNYFFVCVSLSFTLGLMLGVFVVILTRNPVIVNRNSNISDSLRNGHSRYLNSYRETNEIDHEVKDIKENDVKYSKVAFKTEDLIRNKINKYYKTDIYPKGLTENMKNILKDNKNVKIKHTISNILKMQSNITDDTVLYNNIYWGPQIEKSLPKGYDNNSQRIWEKYIEQAEIVKMDIGCGRMHNRLVTFKDGLQACVRYRQNTDQIQGEIFSYYVGRLLELTNLAPSVIKVVDTKNKLWANVANDIGIAQWNTNRAVVLTQYIPNLESANIPNIFKPSSRHLNKYDIYKIALKENGTTKPNILLDKIKTKKTQEKEVLDNFDHLNMKLSKKVIKEFKELAQWTDLIIFDYLTANLDRIVNNLFNYQWNINIMDGPAHNLAKKIDNDLLVFLDNESGLLHGYRLLKKYNIYHHLMLDTLCIFRKSTIDALKSIYVSKDIGSKLGDMYHKKNDAVIRDVLPILPEKNSKLLLERIGRVLSQVDKCKEQFKLR